MKLPSQHASDVLEIANAFAVIRDATMRIAKVLGRNEALNDSVPTNWPLNLSADEFAAECDAMVTHYMLAHSDIFGAEKK